MGKPLTDNTCAWIAAALLPGLFLGSDLLIPVIAGPALAGWHWDLFIGAASFTVIMRVLLMGIHAPRLLSRWMAVTLLAFIGGIIVTILNTVTVELTGLGLFPGV